MARACWLGMVEEEQFERRENKNEYEREEDKGTKRMQGGRKRKPVGRHQDSPGAPDWSNPSFVLNPSFLIGRRRVSGRMETRFAAQRLRPGVHLAPCSEQRALCPRSCSSEPRPRTFRSRGR